MNQDERLDYLVEALCRDSEAYRDIRVERADRRRVVRSLMNIRMPKPVSADLLRVQDEFLQEELKDKGVVDILDIPTVREAYKSELPFSDRISIWQGDITRLSADAIVNAANSQMLGCFVPCHACIDNAIHSAAGLQLREECAQLMRQQGHEEETGGAKITLGYNLPARYVIHTVGPIVYGSLTAENEERLASCYRSCLELADSKELKSIAFCCISTGEFHFPNDRAAEIAVETVTNHLEHSPIERVIFNVFKDVDREIYQAILK